MKEKKRSRERDWRRIGRSRSMRRERRRKLGGLRRRIRSSSIILRLSTRLMALKSMSTLPKFYQKRTKTSKKSRRDANFSKFLKAQKRL